MLKLSAVVGLSISLCASAAVAQHPTKPHASSGKAKDDGVRDKLYRLQVLTQRLDGIRKKAFEDPGVAAAGKELHKLVEANMIKSDPGMKTKIASYQKLRDQFASLAQAGNEAEARKLIPQLEELGRALNEAQSKALRAKELTSKMDVFNSKVQAAMLRIDPASNTLLKEADGLATELRTLMPPGTLPMSPPPGGASPLR